MYQITFFFQICNLYIPFDFIYFFFSVPFASVFFRFLHCNCSIFFSVSHLFDYASNVNQYHEIHSLNPTLILPFTNLLSKELVQIFCSFYVTYLIIKISLAKGISTI